ncbi:hypothetical protein BHM03_00021069 [Ensete ventricosum]|nr:hypothetical protein BHM03_00021069 [Ensete ventricosum]
MRIGHPSNLRRKEPNELGEGLITSLAQSKERSSSGPGSSLSCILGANGEPPLELSPSSSLDLTNSFWTSSSLWFTWHSCTLNESVESEERVSSSRVGRAEPRGWLTDRAIVMFGVPDFTSFGGCRCHQSRVEVWADSPRRGTTRVASAGELSGEQAMGPLSWA